MKPIVREKINRTLNLFGILLLVVVSLPSVYAFHAKKLYGDVWQQLGISEQDGSNNIRQSFLDGWLQFYSARNLRNIATGDRKAVALDLLEYTKKAVQTDDFRKKYEYLRQTRKPIEPKKARTEAEIRQEQVTSIKTALDNTAKALKDAKGDMKAVYQGNYDMFKQQLDDYEKPDNQMIKYMADGEVQQYKDNLKKYQDDLQKWEREYPAGSNLFVKFRLQQVLNSTKDIDYNAALVEKYGKKRFVNPAYESKPSNWKLAFRAGKDVTETVRAYAQQWMSQL
jgi:hypothetical protein